MRKLLPFLKLTLVFVFMTAPTLRSLAAYAQNSLANPAPFAYSASSGGTTPSAFIPRFSSSQNPKNLYFSEKEKMETEHLSGGSPQKLALSEVRSFQRINVHFVDSLSFQSPILRI
jgi:hypothetical protein